MAVDPEARRAAREALEEYPIAVASMRLLSDDFNTTYRVEAAEGRFVMRVGRPGWRDPVDIVSTAAWMRALRADTDLLVPEVVRTHDDADLVTVPATSGEQERHCVLESWVPGPILGKRCSAGLMRELGEVTATMHDHADGFVPPRGFATRLLDRTWSGGLRPVIDGQTSDPMWPARRLQIMREAVQIADGAATALTAADPAGRRFLHCDLHRWNIKRLAGRLAVIDFDDSCWAYPQQDIGIALYYVSGRPDFEALWAAFEAGYRSRREWPERGSGEILRFVLARAVDLVGFVLSDDILMGDELSPWLDGMESRVERLLTDAR